MPRSQELPWSLRGLPSFTRREADRHGIHWRRLAAADLMRPFHGVRLQVADEAPTVRELARAYAKRMPRRQVFNHETAAVLWGIPLPDRPAEPDELDPVPPLLHVSVPWGSARPAARGVHGHILRFDRIDVRVHRGLRMVDPATAWVQLGALLAADDLVAAADFLLTGTEPYDGRPPLCTPPELAVALDAHPGCRGAASLRAAHALARRGALSRRESLLRLDLVRADLPEPVPNHRVLDAGGALLAMIDLAYPEYLVGIEYQSDLHRTPSRWRRDIRRIEGLADAGWVIVQATSDDVSADGGLRDSVQFAERVRRRLRARGWPG
ncbi:hypothetical protein [Agromyces sp. ZXT2-6]|uniref:hypothetical protein n=1 Tax=Agromyces sp. ZXT2-6 TaxID=3461153 RepID=UPI004054B7F7